MPGEIIYCSFDRFPSAKGAATHIGEFVSALGKEFGNVDLVTLPSGSNDRPYDSTADLDQIRIEGVTHFQIVADGSHLIERVLRFRRNFFRWWERRFGQEGLPHAESPKVIHFRSIFEGYPIAKSKATLGSHVIYEVNGLPSIELKYHYPKVADDAEFIKKIEFQEEACFEAADKIVTVSNVNRLNLISRGCSPEKIKVIRNGVDLELFEFQKRDFYQREFGGSRPLKAIYTGTMSAWQGVKDAIEAIALFRRDAHATLRVVGPYRIAEKKSLTAWAENLGVSEFVSIEEAVSKEELISLYHDSDVMLAPLTRNDRNTVQGCCPLKIIEAMATGIPVIASRLAVVEELAEDEKEVFMVRPSSPKSIKDAMFRVLKEPDHLRSMTANARAKVEAKFSWTHAKQSLVDLYRSLQPFT